jgi:hypothetical protein
MATTETPFQQILDVQRTAIEQSNQLFKQNLAMQREAIEAFRGTFDTQESVQRRSVEATQRAVDAYFEALEDAGADVMGVPEVHEAVDEQFAVLLDLHEQSWDAFDQLAEEHAAAFDDYLDQLESLADDSTEAALDTTGQAHEQTEIVVESVEDATER